MYYAQNKQIVGKYCCSIACVSFCFTFYALQIICILKTLLTVNKHVFNFSTKDRFNNFCSKNRPRCMSIETEHVFVSDS